MCLSNQLWKLFNEIGAFCPKTLFLEQILMYYLLTEGGYPHHPLTEWFCNCFFNLSLAWPIIGSNLSTIFFFQKNLQILFSAANVRWDLPVSLFSSNILWIVVQSIPNVAKGGEIAIHRHACKSPDWENSMYAIKKMHLGTVEVLWYLYLDGVIDNQTEYTYNIWYV